MQSVVVRTSRSFGCRCSVVFVAAICAPNFQDSVCFMYWRLTGIGHVKALNRALLRGALLRTQISKSGSRGVVHRPFLARSSTAVWQNFQWVVLFCSQTSISSKHLFSLNIPYMRVLMASIFTLQISAQELKQQQAAVGRIAFRFYERMRWFGDCL